jgi:scyllo-inositol 2-dehydrogenase (NADP+)
MAPVRIAVAGLGRAGMFHVERFGLREDCRIVAAYDDCPAAVARNGRVPGRIAATWHDLISDDEVELVLVATPPKVHAEMAIAALAAGKHVAIETPLGMNVAEADAIRAASHRTGRTVSVLHTRRWDDDFRTARQSLAEGALGRPRTIKFINWHYNPYHSKAVDWRDDALTGGGVMWEFGIHCFDQLLQLAGCRPELVFARAYSAPDARVDDGFLAIVGFTGGLVAHIEVDRLAPVPLQTGWTIIGEAGSYSNFTHYAPNPDGEVVDLPLAPVAAQIDEYYTRLVQHIRAGAANPASADEARGPIALIEAVRKSARSGEVIRVEN